MAEAHGETWWAKVRDRVQKKAKTRMEDDAKFQVARHARSVGRLSTAISVTYLPSS